MQKILVNSVNKFNFKCRESLIDTFISKKLVETLLEPI